MKPIRSALQETLQPSLFDDPRLEAVYFFDELRQRLKADLGQKVQGKEPSQDNGSRR